MVALPPKADEEWRERLAAASSRYEKARIAVLQAACERADLPPPDGGLQYRLALRGEADALREYTRLIVEFSRLMSRRKNGSDVR